MDGFYVAKFKKISNVYTQTQDRTDKNDEEDQNEQVQSPKPEVSSIEEHKIEFNDDEDAIWIKKGMKRRGIKVNF